MNDKRILYLFTRTPLHVGAGSSVGAIDQPIVRERHTGFPVIPGTSLKGTFADEWNEPNGDGRLARSSDGEWLFGATDANNAAAGALQFSEARLLAFPIRSARGSFAWITSPLLLRRAARDGVLAATSVPGSSPRDEQALLAADGPLTLEVETKVKQVVLEEYTFTHVAELPDGLGRAMQDLLKDDVWKEIASRLVILSDGMMSFFARNACEVAQHVAIDDEKGTAKPGALFNQENVPCETLFYSVVHAFQGRGEKFRDKKPGEALAQFEAKLNAANQVYQFGGDASTGLGYCTVTVNDFKGA